jgi:hypothetical protein
MVARVAGMARHPPRVMMHDHPRRMMPGCPGGAKLKIIHDVKEGAMANTQTSKGLQLNTGPLIFGVVLMAVGSTLGVAGFAVGGATLMSAARRWIRDMEQPPSEIVRQHWQKTKAATAAGANAWNNGVPAQH